MKKKRKKLLPKEPNSKRKKKRDKQSYRDRGNLRKLPLRLP
jgi:ribosomal protein S14